MISLNSDIQKIIESIGTITSSNHSQNAWNSFNDNSIPRINASSSRIKDSISKVKYLSAEKAKIQAQSIRVLIPIIQYLKSNIEQITAESARPFKTASLELINSIIQLNNQLNAVEDLNENYQLSEAVLSTDWNNHLDDHWNTY
ncbi:MAG: hypothetical protein NBV77_02905 [Bacteroidia bacterium]|nr:hypothetical protein [Bacteroidia bacterium]